MSSISSGLASAAILPILNVICEERARIRVSSIIEVNLSKIRDERYTNQIRHHGILEFVSVGTHQGKQGS